MNSRVDEINKKFKEFGIYEQMFPEYYNPEDFSKRFERVSILTSNIDTYVSGSSLEKREHNA